MEYKQRLASHTGQESKFSNVTFLGHDSQSCSFITDFWRRVCWWCWKLPLCCIKALRSSSQAPYPHLVHKKTVPPTGGSCSREKAGREWAWALKRSPKPTRWGVALSDLGGLTAVCGTAFKEHFQEDDEAGLEVLVGSSSQARGEAGRKHGPRGGCRRLVSTCSLCGWACRCSPDSWKTMREEEMQRRCNVLCSSCVL